MRKYKIFLCGITQNKKRAIDELTKDIYSFFDGLIWVDHQSTDGTKELLEERSGDGEIITLPFMDNHGWSMNAILNSKKILPDDFILFKDSDEMLNIDFCKGIRDFCDILSANNINTVFSYGKPFIFKFFSNIYISGHPHWGVVGARERFFEISTHPAFKDPKTYSWNVRNERRSKDHWIDHFAKYYLAIRSNHLLLGNEKNLDEFYSRENVRCQFLHYWIRTLKQEPTVKALKDYILTQELNYELKSFINYERCLNDFYRYHILKHDVEIILDDHHKKNPLFIIS